MLVTLFRLQVLGTKAPKDTYRTGGITIKPEEQLPDFLRYRP